MAKRKRRGTKLAASADKYDLYQQSVQDPEFEVSFMRRLFRRYYSHPPTSLREDFCGSAAISCHWAESNPQHIAYAVDLDPEPLRWCMENSLPALTPSAAERVKLTQEDVRTTTLPRTDLLLAANFSYFVFHDRNTLRSYFQAALQNLNREGLMVLDIYGGPDAQTTMEESRELDNFEYVFEQHSFDPIHHATTCFIHFNFPDGSRLKRAFRYDWRLWTIPEVRELLIEAGFRKTEVYWEGVDAKTEEGNGKYRPREKAPDDPAWVAFIVALP